MNDPTPLLGRHGAAWLLDRRYRLSWLIGPQAVGLAFVAWAGSREAGPPVPPRSAEWAHASDDRQYIAALAALRSRAQTDQGAERTLEARAEAGDKAAQFFMGTLLDPTIDRARATPERTREAINWYRRSADQGVASAMANLGLLLSRDDLGPEPDYSEAFKWLETAAPRVPAAQRNLALLYMNGRGVAIDKAKAIELLRAAADRGDPIAETVLAEALDHGDQGLTADPHEAVLLLQRAAMQNDAAAQRELALHLQAGKGVPANRERALFWFTKAAANGDSVAKAELAATSGVGGVPSHTFSDHVATPSRPVEVAQTPGETQSSVEVSRDACPLKPWHGGGGRGEVLGFLSEGQAATLLSRTQAAMNAPISPAYLHNVRAVVSEIVAGGTKHLVALIPDGMAVKRGDSVTFDAGHRDATRPCSYVPNLITGILAAPAKDH